MNKYAYILFSLFGLASFGLFGMENSFTDAQQKHNVYNKAKRIQNVLESATDEQLQSFIKKISDVEKSNIELLQQNKTRTRALNQNNNLTTFDVLDIPAKAKRKLSFSDN